MVLIELGLPEGLDPGDGAGGGCSTRALAAGLVTDGRDRRVRGAAAGLLAHARGDPRGEPADRGGVEPRHLAALGARSPDFIAEAGPALAALGTLRINCFGHLGDGNLHYNVFPAAGPQPRPTMRPAASAIKTAGA